VGSKLVSYITVRTQVDGTLELGGRRLEKTA